MTIIERLRNIRTATTDEAADLIEQQAEVLKQTFGEYLEEDYSNVPDGRVIGEFTASDLKKAAKALDAAMNDTATKEKR